MAFSFAATGAEQIKPGIVARELRSLEIYTELLSRVVKLVRQLLGPERLWRRTWTYAERRTAWMTMAPVDLAHARAGLVTVPLYALPLLARPLLTGTVPIFLGGFAGFDMNEP
jgi:hypothetical protein